MDDVKCVEGESSLSNTPTLVRSENTKYKPNIKVSSTIVLFTSNKLCEWTNVAVQEPDHLRTFLLVSNSQTNILHAPFCMTFSQLY